MLIGKKYKIESDSLNVIVYKKRTKKDKSVYWTVISYHSNFGNALKALVDMEVGETYLEDFKKVVAKQEELYKLIAGIKKGGK